MQNKQIYQLLYPAREVARMGEVNVNWWNWCIQKQALPRQVGLQLQVHDLLACLYILRSSLMPQV